jgi:hypothetical protein
MGKHLYGPTKDLSLQCCLNEKNCNKIVYEDANAGGNCPYIKGLAIATCFHNIFQWKKLHE